MKLAAIMLGTENAAALAAFYTKMLGEPGWQQDEWYGYDVQGTHIMIGPHSEVKGKSKEPARIIIQFDANDVHAEFTRIKECGAIVVAEPYQPSKEDMPDTWLATLADPDGNYIQLATPWKDDAGEK